MWILTCDGDILGGKRLWLRPGTVHLLGRTTGRMDNGERVRYIDHKSVSRKHLTIHVGTVKSGDSSKLYERSEIVLEDASKTGTTLNGEKFSHQTKTLDGKDFTIKLGSYEPVFHLVWHPVTLSFTSLPKKSKGDPLAAHREKLERTDIKIIPEYVANETTHAISKKRNTPQALQALLQARWLITEEFVDALAGAVSQASATTGSVLEEDFDGNWPAEDQFLVPAGTEPQPRPNSFVVPNANRAEVFKDYMFVFLSQAQYDILLPVITTGSGKALLWEVQLGESNVEDVVDYIKQIAGRKGQGQFVPSQQTQRGGVVVVRLNGGDEGWREFARSIDLALDQRSVEQNQFLDAVLTVDASGLKERLKEAQDSVGSTGNAIPANARSESQPRQQPRATTVDETPAPADRDAPPRAPPAQPEERQEQPPAAAPRRNRRVITQSRFKAFDDFDPSQFSKPATQSPEPSFDNREASQAPSVQSMEVDEPSQNLPSQKASRKRPAPERNEQDAEEQMYAAILTGQAAMKRRRTEAVRAGEKNSFAKPLTESDRTLVEKSTKAKKKAKDMDVMAEVQARRKAAEERHQNDQESLRNQLEGVDINELRDLAQVEDMELPERQPPPRRGGAENGTIERWDPAWNGRKNFKRFRPQGLRQEGPRLNRVIVALEEVPRKGHGIGDEYWLNAPSSTSRSKSKSQSQSQSVRQAQSRSQQAGEDDDDDATRFQRRLQNSRADDEENAAREEVYPEEIAGQARDKTLEAVAHGTPSQTMRPESQKSAGKRPATQQAGGPPKRARQSRLAAPSREPINLDDDDDDDGLKFRRRRR